mmetsp:Transcript_49342/g.98636  ORF Transcript_49342/g.98636 Transcript_49342/m.98636 type:complete len:271 (-) Transcript_49342:258-1070(-)
MRFGSAALVKTKFRMLIRSLPLHAPSLPSLTRPRTVIRPEILSPTTLSSKANSASSSWRQQHPLPHSDTAAYVPACSEPAATAFARCTPEKTLRDAIGQRWIVRDMWGVRGTTDVDISDDDDIEEGRGRRKQSTRYCRQLEHRTPPVQFRPARIMSRFSSSPPSSSSSRAPISPPLFGFAGLPSPVDVSACTTWVLRDVPSFPSVAVLRHFRSARSSSALLSSGALNGTNPPDDDDDDEPSSMISIAGSGARGSNIPQLRTHPIRTPLSV